MKLNVKTSKHQNVNADPQSWFALAILLLIFSHTFSASAQSDLIQTTQPVYGPLAPGGSATSRPEAGESSFLEQYQAGLARVIEQISPCVVAVQVDHRPDRSAGPVRSSNVAGGTTGSGVIIAADGIILTSHHVIESAMAINVVLHDGRRLRARKVAADPRADLAILRVEAGDLKAASLGDATKLRRGHLVLALGNPLGLASDGQAAVSEGIVSAIARPLPEAFGRDEDRYYGDMIQTSVNIQPGNSGGPLIDLRGQVVGIITATGLSGPSEQTIAFAMPIVPRTRRVIEKLLAGEEVRYGYAGVRVGSLRELSGSPAGEGVYLETVFPDGPAYAAGLRGGDIVVELNRSTVLSPDDFIQRIGSAGPEQTVAVVYRRRDTLKEVHFSLASRASQVAGAEQPEPFVFRGAMLTALSAEIRAAQHLPERCFLVLSIDSGSACDRAGLTPGDIIVRVEGKPIETSEVQRMSASDQDVLLGLSNGGSFLVGGRQ